MARWREKVAKLVWLGVFLSLLSLLGVLGHLHFFFDLFSHFRVQYFVGVALLIACAVPLRLYTATGLLVIVFVVHGYEVGRMYYSADSPRTEQQPTFRLLTSNLLASNTSYGVLLEYVRRVKPDVIVFQEYSFSWDSALRGELAAYSHRLTEPRDGVFGIAVYSKLPLKKRKIVAFGYSASPSIDVDVMLSKKTIRVIGTHPYYPVGSKVFVARNTQLQKIAKAASVEAGPMLIAGDLNVSPWSVHFKDLLKVGGLRDGRRGLGILPTWPGFFFPLQIPIDHILVKSGVSVVNMQVSDRFGSDHLGLWADVLVD